MVSRKPVAKVAELFENERGEIGLSEKWLLRRQLVAELFAFLEIGGC